MGGSNSSNRTMTNQRKELGIALQSAVDQCRFLVHRDIPVTSAALREMYENGVEGLVGWRDYNLTVSIDDNNPALETFVEALRDSVSDCLDEKGCVGDGLVALMGGGDVYPPIERYARSLLRPGATLGAGTVVDILCRWMSGAPVRYKRQYALANNVASGDPTLTIDVADGVQMSALPTSSQPLYRRFPSLNGAVDATELMGKVLLTVEWISDVPGIFKSGPKAPWHRRTVAPDFNPDRFCEAMSLAMNESVCWHFTWGDYGELREFNPVGAGGFAQTIARWRGEAIPLSQEKLQQAMTICAQRATAGGRALESALYRWSRSKEPGQDFANQLIELRIALESLYAGPGRTEVTFRQAAHGALHLGRDYKERLRYRKLLKDVYGLASGAVHGGDMEPTQRNRSLLGKGRDACRQGILKCLADGEDLDFDRLMFDR